MSVTLTVSETINGSAYSDALSGGGTGIDIGSCINGQYAPIGGTGIPNNDGHQTVFIRHDAVTDPVTDLKLFLQNYGVGTGFTYGGQVSAGADRTRFLNMGDASNTSYANNQDGLGGGIHIDMDWQVSMANQFAPARLAAQHRIFGDNGGATSGEGRNLASAIVMHADAMSYEDTGSETDATTPVAGVLGKQSDAVHGNRAHFLLRQMLRSDEVDGGIMQTEIVIAYSYTA
jgi:hypothetical protein